LKKVNTAKQQESGSPEKVSASDALRRMKKFAERKEKFVAAVKKSKD
jgi:hypothetical protein